MQQNFLQIFHNRGAKILIFTFLASTVVFLLAAGLTGLELLPGDPNAFGWVVQSLEPGGGSLSGGETIMKVIRVVYIITLILLPVWIVYIIVNPKARKRFLRDMVLFAVLVAALLAITSRLAQREPTEEDQPLSEFGKAPDLGLPGEGEFDPNAAPPESIVWVASLVVAFFIVIILALAIWIILRSRRKEESAVDRIAVEVQNALDEIQDGQDFRNVVMRCYSEMVQSLKKERNIQRSGSLTPREFEDALNSLGFPIQPVRDLTRLFENVRYGRKEISRREELIAVDSLSAILDACRSKV